MALASAARRSHEERSIWGSARRHAAAWQTRGGELLGAASQGATALRGDRSLQVAAASAVGGAAVLGAGGAGAGLLVGGTLGAVAGLLPAILTLGLSVPLGAAICGTSGLVLGGLLGGAAGLTTAGAVGYATQAKRTQIEEWVDGAQSWMSDALVRSKKTAISYASAIGWNAGFAFVTVKDRAASVVETTSTKTMQLASESSVQATVVSALGGGVVLGAGGAATGLMAGSAMGAAVGLVPALFTFGLSIPICAAVGGGCGLVTGAAAGGVTGVAVGGVGCYSAFRISGGMCSALEWAGTSSSECTSVSGTTGETSD